MPPFLSGLIATLGSPGGGIAVLGAIILVGVIWLMSGRMIPKASLLREVEAEKRRADEHKVAAEEWKTVALTLSGNMPRVVSLLETMDSFVRTSHALPVLPEKTVSVPLPALPPDGGHP